MIRRVNLPLFLFALTLAFVVKVAVHQAQQLAETTVPAQVRYEPADENLIILDPLAEVMVRLRGPRSEIAALNPFSVEVGLSLEKGEEGLITVTEDRLNVNVRTPGDFEIVSIEPNSFILTVEPQEHRVLPVRAELTGEPAAGAYVETPDVRPPRVDVVGPRSMVATLDELVVTVSLDGHALTWEATVAVVSPDPLVKIEPRQVVVHVPMKVPGSESSVFDGYLEEEEPIE